MGRVLRDKDDTIQTRVNMRDMVLYADSMPVAKLQIPEEGLLQWSWKYGTLETLGLVKPELLDALEKLRDSQGDDPWAL